MGQAFRRDSTNVLLLRFAKKRGKGVPGVRKYYGGTPPVPLSDLLAEFILGLQQKTSKF
jgi:hypothetical protein